MTQTQTSICLFRCCLKLARRIRNIDRDNSKTSGTDEAPFLERATQRYCLMALMNISLDLNTGPAFYNMLDVTRKHYVRLNYVSLTPLIDILVFLSYIIYSYVKYTLYRLELVNFKLSTDTTKFQVNDEHL